MSAGSQQDVRIGISTGGWVSLRSPTNSIHKNNNSVFFVLSVRGTNALRATSLHSVHIPTRSDFAEQQTTDANFSFPELVSGENETTASPPPDCPPDRQDKKVSVRKVTFSNAAAYSPAVPKTNTQPAGERGKASPPRLSPGQAGQKVSVCMRERCASDASDASTMCLTLHTAL